jgi:hypothetical protein
MIGNAAKFLAIFALLLALNFDSGLAGCGNCPGDRDRWCASKFFKNVAISILILNFSKITLKIHIKVGKRIIQNIWAFATIAVLFINHVVKALNANMMVIRCFAARAAD